jgi:hypothetical protein
MTSIEWTKITPRMKVTLETGKQSDRFGHKSQWYHAAGKLVTMSSRDARRAQAWLDRRVKADKKRFG